MIQAEHRYTEKELIKAINDQFGDNTLNRSMLAYMRDIRKLLPKPIRTHLRSNHRGGAYSYYTKDTLQLLQLIFKEKIHEGKNLKQIEEEHHAAIEQAIFNTDVYRENIKKGEHDLAQTMERVRKMMEPMLDSFKNLKESAARTLEVVFLSQQLESALKAIQDNNEEEINRALTDLNLTIQLRQKLRLKKKALMVKNVLKKEKSAS